jgi:hypothetical protein
LYSTRCACDRGNLLPIFTIVKRCESVSRALRDGGEGVIERATLRLGFGQTNVTLNDAEANAGFRQRCKALADLLLCRRAAGNARWSPPGHSSPSYSA